MLVYYMDRDITFFTTDYSDKIEVQTLFRGVPNLLNQDYVVGNNIAEFIKRVGPAGNQVFVDVGMLGVTSSALEEFGIEAVVYGYNNYYMPNDEIMRVDKPIMVEIVGRQTSDCCRQRIYINFSDNERFDLIRQTLKVARSKSNYVGATWPTCHYQATRQPYVMVMYSNLI